MIVLDSGLLFLGYPVYQGL